MELNSLKIRTGCSGYYNNHWKEIFYPETLPPDKWFEFYSRQFNSVELNTTFYRFPTVESFHKWYKKSPAGFLFSVKAPKLITHLKRFNDCEQLVSDLYSACEHGLRDKLACILFQLPSGIQYSKEKLQQIITCLKPEFKNVIEFRHKSWWTKKVYDHLAENKITFCSVSHPDLPDTIIANTSTVYLRLHGIPEIFNSGYSDEQLAQLYGSILKKKKMKECYVYFNNTAGNEAILNAQQFQKLLQDLSLNIIG